MMKQAIAGRIVIGAIAWIATAQASVANLASPSIQSAVIDSSSLSQTWSEKAIQGLATEFNCGQNYPQANQQTIRSATRYELAATLHHCLQAMHSKKAIANNLSTLQQLQTEFRKELDTLRGTVDTLDLEVNNREETPTSTSKSPAKNTEKEVIAPRQVKLSPQSSAEQLYFGYKNQADFLTSFQTQTTQSEIKPHPIHQNLAQQINSASKKTYPSVGGPENQKPSPIQILQQQQLDLLPNLALASDTPSLTQGINPNLDNVTVQAEFQPTEQLKFSGAIGYSLTESPNQGYEKRDELVNWVASAQLSNFLGEDRVGYLSLSQTHQPSHNSGTKQSVFNSDQLQSHLQAEAGYKIALSKNFSITPGVIWLIQPDKNAGAPDTVISVIRTNFKF